MTGPLLSVIVPVYKTECYLQDCIDSLLSQQLESMEVILVDDGSPDSCPVLCDDWAARDSRIRVVHKSNAGLGLARNSGLAVAQGKYVSFVDSDDYIEAGTYSFLLQKYADLDPDVVYFRYARFVDGTRGKAVPSSTYEVFSGQRVQDLMLDMMAAPISSKKERVIECSACTAIYRRSLIADHAVRFHSERELYSEDMIFNLDVLAYVTCAVYDHSAFYFYRTNPASVTHAINMNRAAMLAPICTFMSEAIPGWKLSAKEAGLRKSRLFIGSARSEISNAMASSSPRKFKKEYFHTVVNMPEVRACLKSYPWRAYSFYQRLFFWAIRLRSFGLAWFLSHLKSRLS